MKKGMLNLIILSSLTLMILVLTIFFRSESYAARSTLYWGSKGSQVKLVQWKLTQWGYYSGRIDGIFGRDTALAVKKFQRKNGIHVDGLVGPRTWKALGYNPTVKLTPTKTVTAAAVNRNDNVQMVARLIHAEARGEPFEGQVAVGAVLLNRVDSSSFPNSISGVIYQPLAFESVANGEFNRAPTQENIRAARSAINGWDPTYGSLFFWNPSKPVNKWIWSRQIVRTIGGHVFAL